MFLRKGYDQSKILQQQFFQYYSSDRVGSTTVILTFTIARTQVVFLIFSEACCPALVHNRSTVSTEHHPGEHPHFTHLRWAAPCLPCQFNSIGNRLRPDGIMGILENDPFAFRIIYDLFTLVGFLRVLKLTVCPRYSRQRSIMFATVVASQS